MSVFPSKSSCCQTETRNAIVSCLLKVTNKTQNSVGFSTRASG